MELKLLKKTVAPENSAAAAQFLYENGIEVVLSWTDDDFFTKKINMQLAVPADKIELLETQRYLKN